MKKAIANLKEIPLERFSHGEKFECQDGPIGPVVGAKKLGYSLIVVPPGKRTYPFHCHHINEEMFFIVEGHGTVRIGDQSFPIQPGDVIAAPPGGKDTAHQIINTSDQDLRYLAVSTMIPAEVVEYPDSGKVGVSVGSAPGEDPSLRTFQYRGRLGTVMDYWDGED